MILEGEMKPGKPSVFWNITEGSIHRPSQVPVSCTVVFLTLLRPWLRKSWVFHKKTYFYQPFKHNWMKILKKAWSGRVLPNGITEAKQYIFLQSVQVTILSWMSSISCGDGLFYVDSTPDQELHKEVLLRYRSSRKQHLVS